MFLVFFHVQTWKLKLPRFLLLQAEFSEVNLVSHSNGTCNVDMQVTRGGTKVVRSASHTPLIYYFAFSVTLKMEEVENRPAAVSISPEEH